MTRFIGCLCLVLLATFNSREALCGPCDHLGIDPPGGARIVGSPNQYLPEWIEGTDGALSLVAFYGSRRYGSVLVYVVNRTEEAACFPTQDGYPYLKLEARRADGTWERAEPHTYATCGNSYARHELPPGHFFVVRGYAPAEGERRTVRYRIHPSPSYGNEASPELFSNEGAGSVLPQDVETARHDGMAIREGSLDLLEGVVTGDIVVSRHVHGYPVQAAYSSLRRFAGNARARRLLLDQLTGTRCLRVGAWAFDALRRVDREAAVEFATSVLTASEHPLREAILDHVGGLANGDDPLTDALESIVTGNPLQPGYRDAIRAYASTRSPRAERTLRNLLADPRSGMHFLASRYYDRYYPKGSPEPSEPEGEGARGAPNSIR